MKGERKKEKKENKGGERERERQQGLFWKTITLDCAIYRLPARPLCKGKWKGGGTGERTQEKNKGTGQGERERGKGMRKRAEKGETDRQHFSLGNHNCGLCHL